MFVCICENGRLSYMNILLRFIQKIRRWYWYIIRPITEGVRAVIVNNNGEVLLVQHTYAKGWFLPGGGVKNSETLEEAIKRELREEVGITVNSSIEVLGEYENNYEYKQDTITVFTVNEYELNQKSHFEIDMAEFFHLNVLPEGIAPGTRKRIEEYLKLRAVTKSW